MSRQYNNWGRDQINIEQVQGNVLFQGQAPPTRPREELLLLQILEDEVISRLDQSLHHAVLINLKKEAQPGQVNRPWERELRVGLKPTTPLPVDQTIAQVFDDAAIRGKLLILGQPGAGKTTTLLDLAKVLLERARADIHQPIPIILNLSTWKDEKQPIQDWVIAELKSKYGVSLKLGRQWVSDRKLLPLLDGLDEVAPERQESCVVRVNEFLSSESSPLYVTVCSRLAEYENLTQQLHLNGAVCLKALSNEHIQTYLTQLDRPFLWQVLSHHPDLLEMVRSPLLLSITLLAYPQDSSDQWEQLQGASDPLQFLLDAYIERMLHRQFESQVYAKCKIPNDGETREWLIWLAHQMVEQAQTEFLIEDLQPSMLSKRQRSLYLAILGLSAGMCSGLGCGINEPSGKLLVGLLSGWLVWWGGGSIKPLENLKWSWQRSLHTGARCGLGGGLAGGVTTVRIGEQSNVLVGGLLGGLLVGLIGWLLGGITGETVEQKLVPNQGIKRSVKNSVTTGLLIGLILGLFFGLIIGLIFRSLNITPSWSSSWLSWGLIGLMVWLICGLFVGLVSGGLVCLKHFVLRVLLYKNKKIPWNYACFLNYCTERLFLQRVGGRYRFIHKYLQDHFAAIPLAPVPVPNKR